MSSERLRVALATPFLYPHVGGVESHVEALAADLARRGHDVRVLTTRLPGTPVEEYRHGYRVHRVRALATLFSTPVTPRLEEAVALSRPDVVHSHTPPPLTALFAARAARRLRVPHALTYHCDLEIPIPGGSLLVEAYRRTLWRRTIDRADGVIATTRTYAETSRSLWRRGDVDVIPNPVDADRFSPASDARLARERHALGERPVALFVGRLTHHKGVEEFVRSAQFTEPDVAHVIVGDGPRREALERLARDEGVAGKVVFAGRVEFRDLPSYYAACDASVLPSTSRLEAFGIAALEAMATARPVVASNIPGVAEVVVDGETGLLAEPLDARGLAQKIDLLVGDRELSRSMGTRARARVLERFTVGAVVDRVEGVYRRLLDDASR